MGMVLLRIMGFSSGSRALFCTPYRVKELRLGAWMKSQQKKKGTSET